MEAPLPIYLTIDVGPADAVMGHGHSNNPEWAPALAGLVLLRDALMCLEDRLQLTMPATWFIRADRLVQNQFGRRLAVLQLFMNKMGASVVRDHELGWMPQLPIQGVDAIDYEDLHLTHTELTSFLPSLNSVRMGDCYHDNTSMRLLDDLGIRFDSSAIPGREKKDHGWRMDWRGTLDWAYHPSCKDYRYPGSPQRSILEIPMSVIPIQAPYDQTPLLRYVNPCFFSQMVWPELPRLISEAPYIVCTLHPDELIKRMQGGHPLVAYSVDEFVKNLTGIVNQAQKFGRTVSFHRLRDFDNQPQVRKSPK